MTYPGATFAPLNDLGRVVIWRESPTVLMGYVPVCPGDEVSVGVSVYQGPGPNDGIGEAGNEGVFEGAGVSLLRFEISPDASVTGSLTSELPTAQHAGPFNVPADTIADLGGFFVDTGRTYAAWDLDRGLPEVGTGWVFSQDPEPETTADLGAELTAARASVSCDTSY